MQALHYSLNQNKYKHITPSYQENMCSNFIAWILSEDAWIIMYKSFQNNRKIINARDNVFVWYALKLNLTCMGTANIRWSVQFYCHVDNRLRKSQLSYLFSFFPFLIFTAVQTGKVSSHFKRVVYSQYNSNENLSKHVKRTACACRVKLIYNVHLHYFKPSQVCISNQIYI